MKKLLMIFLLLLSVTMAAIAGYVEVKKGGKSIGGLTYSYRIQPSNSGCLIHVDITNGTGEFVRGRITGTGTERSCGTSFRVNPHGKTKEVFGSAETPKTIILEYVQVED